MPNITVKKATLDLVLSFVNAKTWEESKRIVEEHQDVLLTDEADAAFGILLAQNPNDEQAKLMLTNHREVLRHARSNGIDATFAGAGQKFASNEDIAQALNAFANARTWDESKRILEEQRALLLNDAADKLLETNIAQAQNAGNEQAARILTTHRDILRRARAEGIDAAFISNEDIAQALNAFVNAGTGAEKKRILEEQRALLLNDAADKVIESALAKNAGNEQATRTITEHREILRRSRTEGIDAAFVGREQPTSTISIPAELVARLKAAPSTEEAQRLLDEHPDEELQRMLHKNPELKSQLIAQLKGTAQPRSYDEQTNQAVLAFVNAKNWNERKRIVEAQQAILFTDAADHVFNDLLAKYKGDENLERHRDILRRARAEGIDAVFVSNEDIAQALNAFVNAKTWDESKRILEEQRALLLSDAADKLLETNIAQAQNAGNDQATRVFTTHRDILRRARAEGIDAVFISNEDIAQALNAFVNARTWDESKRILEEQRALLLSDAADKLLETNIAQAQNAGNDQATRVFTNHRDLLRRARAEGIDAVFVSNEDIAQALNAFVNAKTWDESKRILEEQRALLLSDAADKLLETNIAQAQNAGNDQAARVFTTHRDILRRARTEGIDAAFAGRVQAPSGLESIPPELLARLQQVQTEEEMQQLLEEHPELLPVLEQIVRQQTQSPDANLAQTLQAWITTDTWDASKAYLTEHQNVLLTDAAEAAIERLIQVAQQQNDENVIRILTTHRDILRRARAEGIDAAFISNEDIAQALNAFVNAKTWDESKRILEEQRALLLNDAADKLLETNIAQAQNAGNEQATRVFTTHRDILRRSRTEGIDVTFDGREQPTSTISIPAELVARLKAAPSTEEAQRLLDEHPDEELQRMLHKNPELKSQLIAQLKGTAQPRSYDEQTNQAVLAFVNAKNWNERKRIVEAQQAILFTDAADHVFNDLLAKYKGDENLERHRDMLRRARTEGIDAAFAGRVQQQAPSHLQELFTKADSADDRYAATGNLEDLEQAATGWDTLLNHSEFATAPLSFQLRTWNNASITFSRRYNARGNIADLDRALSMVQQAVALTPPESPDKPGYLNNLGLRLSDRYARTGAIADLEQALEYAQQAVTLTPPDSPDRAGYLNNLGICYSDRYARTGALADLERALQCAEQAVALTPPDSPDRPGHLNNLGLRLSYRYARTGAIADLERALACAEQAVTLTPPDSPARAGYLNNLGNHYSDRYARTGAISDLERALACAEQAVALTPPDSPDRAGYLNNLGAFYSYRYARTGALADLEQALECAQQAVTLTPPDSPDRPSRLNNLGNHYSSRYARTGALADLEQALACAEQAVALTPPDSPDRPSRLNNLGNRYSERYARTGAIADLEQALQCAEQAVALTPPDSPDRPGYLNSLGAFYSYRYARTGAIADLEQALQCAEQAVALTPPDSPELPRHLNNLGNRYSERYARTGALADLERALACAEQAVALTPPDSPARAARLNNLGGRYSERYARTGALADLERALQCAEQAVTLTPPDSPDRAALLNNLGGFYSDRYARTGALADLERALQCAEQAVALTPPDSPDRAMHLNNLGAFYSDRYARTGTIADLEQALQCAEQAVALTPPDSPDRASRLNNLGSFSSDRYARTGAISDLERAEQHYRQALALYAAPPSPEAPPSPTVYGGGTDAPPSPTVHRGETDAPPSSSVHSGETDAPPTFPLEYRTVANNLGRLLYDAGRYADARWAFEQAHRALEHLRAEEQSEAMRRKLSDENAALYARLVFCCLHLGDSEAAFAYAVAGKGRTFVDMLSSTRFDLSAVGADQPELLADIERARELQREVDALVVRLTGDRGRGTGGLRGQGSGDGGQGSGDRGQGIGVRGQGSGDGGQVTGVRNQESAEALRQQDYEELLRLRQVYHEHWQGMAQRHPVLTATRQAPALAPAQAQALATTLNATLVEFYEHAQGWCAFVISPSGVQHVALPVDAKVRDNIVTWIRTIEAKEGGIKTSKVHYRILTACYRALIEPLHAHLPQPDTGQRVVLATHGILNRLPLGALQRPDDKRYLADMYELAHVPTLSALHAMQQQRKRDREVGIEPPRRQERQDSTISKNRALVVAHVPDQPRIEQATKDMAAATFFDASRLTAYYRGEDDATVDKVINATKTPKDIIHLTCHGGFDWNRPEQSGLYLSDGVLRVQQIITELRLQQTQLVTLAACQSAQAQIERSNEGVGITHAFLLSGAPGVVAALWSVPSHATLELFKLFYQRVREGEAPAIALQAAAKAVREMQGYEHPYYWAGFQVYGLAF